MITHTQTTVFLQKLRGLCGSQLPLIYVASRDRPALLQQQKWIMGVQTILWNYPQSTDYTILWKSLCQYQLGILHADKMTFCPNFWATRCDSPLIKCHHEEKCYGGLPSTCISKTELEGILLVEEHNVKLKLHVIVYFFKLGSFHSHAMCVVVERF